MLFAEMVCYYTYHNKSIYQKLMEIYDRYGFVFDTNISTAYSGLNAMKEMNAVVDKMKEIQIEEVGGIKVLATRDYSKAQVKKADGTIEQLDSAKTNAVYYELDGGSFICIRPSGTEPKLKVYYSLKCKDMDSAKELFEKVKLDFSKYLN